MNPTPRVVVAGQPAALPSPLPAGEWLTPTGDGLAILLPGVCSIGGRLVVVLPRCYARARLDPESALASVALFVSSLARYARERPAGRAVADPLLDAQDDALVRVGEPDDLVDSVEAALLLWRDHLVNGPFVVSAPRVHDQIPGRVLWGRALRQGAPVESRAGVVFRQIPRTSVRPDPRHELAELHETTCAEVGARFGLGSQIRSRTFGRKEALDRIERGERVSFADRPRRLLSLLRRYYSHPSRGASGDGQVRGLFARNYAYVWERMLQVALRDEGRGEGLRGAYRLSDGSHRTGLNLRPDLVMRARLPNGRAVLLVLDAKDYAANAWPASSDLAKQVLYRLLLSELVCGDAPPLDDVGNAFLFPALVPGSGVALRGVHDLLGPPRPGHPGRVLGLALDLEQVAEAYLAGRSARGLREAVASAVFVEAALPSAPS